MIGRDIKSNYVTEFGDILGFSLQSMYIGENKQISLKHQARIALEDFVYANRNKEG